MEQHDEANRKIMTTEEERQHENKQKYNQGNEFCFVRGFLVEFPELLN